MINQFRKEGLNPNLTRTWGKEGPALWYAFWTIFTTTTSTFNLFTRSEREVFIYERKTWECVRFLEISTERKSRLFSDNFFIITSVLWNVSIPRLLTCLSEFTINRHLNQNPPFWSIFEFLKGIWEIKKSSKDNSVVLLESVR